MHLAGTCRGGGREPAGLKSGANRLCPTKESTSHELSALASDWCLLQRYAVSMAEAQALLQSLSEEYQRLQQGWLDPVTLPLSGTRLTCGADLQSSVASRQKLEGQRQENLGVQKAGFVSIF